MSDLNKIEKQEAVLGAFEALNKKGIFDPDKISIPFNHELLKKMRKEKRK